VKGFDRSWSQNTQARPSCLAQSMQAGYLALQKEMPTYNQHMPMHKA